MANLQPEAERQVLLGQQEPKLHRNRTENYRKNKINTKYKIQKDSVKYFLKSSYD